MIKRVLHILHELWVRRNPQAFVKYLRNCGIEIGEGTFFQDPRYTEVDTTRPSLIKIGKNCFFNRHVEFHTHDWASHVFLNMGLDMVNTSGPITIGDNVAFGRHVTILKDVTIGDNCFIGGNSLINKSIPANSVAVGIPAKVIMTIDELYQRRISVSEQSAFEYARSIAERFHRLPTPGEFREEFPLFVSGNEVNNYPEIPFRRQLGPSYDRYIKSHIAKYDSFHSFLKAAGIDVKS